MSDLGYIAACELCSPNSPEFERVLAQCRRHKAELIVNKLKAQLFDELNCGGIDDESYCVVFDALNDLVFEYV